MAGLWRWKAAQFAERKWWQQYLKNKDVSEYLVWKKAYWNTLIDKTKPYLQIKPSDVLLDAGCGPAGIFMAFPNHQITAFDPLLDHYEEELNHFSKSQYPQVEFVTSSIEDFKAHTQYDVIFCMNAINHVQHIGQSIDILIHALKPNGTLLITIDAHNMSFFKTLFRLLPGDILHPHQYDLNEYELMIRTRNCTMLHALKLKHEFFFDHYMLIARKNA
ncbi:MAG: class I SAM-dependent methyltransferase [Chitinophagaceae bacterium]